MVDLTAVIQSSGVGKCFLKIESDWNKVKGRREETILTKKEIGRRGEEIAAEFLERKGLQIVERNYHSRWGELDLVAVKPDTDGFEGEACFGDTVPNIDGDTCGFRENPVDLAEFHRRNGGVSSLPGPRVHFVEVKTRTGMGYGTPGAAVTYTKQQKLRKTALVWLQEQEQYYSDLCFDVIEVWVVGETAKIRWLQGCF